MSALATESATSTVAGELTTSLIPTVTRIDTRLDVSPISVVLAVSIVCILSPITVTGNSIILAAFYRYKRLRTASNCLLVSLAVSDFGVGVFMPFGMQLELSGLPENGVSTLCIVPYCIVIALCSVSVLVTVAIAVDRLTSLAQPLRYKNIITHSSIEKYIAVFWIYAIGVGFSPLVYAQVAGETQQHSGSCRFDAAVLPPVRVFLVVAVWAPSALVLLGCYMYVYLVARAHARAIYTVELSFRHQTQTLVLPRYGQTLVVTVGAFLILWLPFQTCMLVDIFCGTKILSEWTVVWLGLPILAHSGANPWIYAFHHGEMRVAAGKIAEDLVALFGVTPSRYGCSPTRRGTNTNLELAEVNNSQEDRRQPVEDCFAAKHSVLYASRRCLEISSRHADISPERNTKERVTSFGSREGDIVEEDIHDLTKMLDPKYIIDRNHVIDSNHNIDKIKNLKYLLDPTFNKIRHLRRLNHKRLTRKNFSKFSEPKFISYQNLKSDGSFARKPMHMNTMSDPMLNADSPAIDAKDFGVAMRRNSAARDKRNSSLSSMSDPNIKATTGNNADVHRRMFPACRNMAEDHRYSVQNLDHHNRLMYDGGLARHAIHCCRLENQRKLNGYSRPSAKPDGYFDRPPYRFQHQISCTSLSTPESTRSSSVGNSKQRTPPRQFTITPNRLASIAHPDPTFPLDNPDRTVKPGRLSYLANNSDTLRHSESINSIEPAARFRLPEPSRTLDALTVPTIHSEPPSPIDPHPLTALQEEDARGCEVSEPIVPGADRCSSEARSMSPARRSHPVQPPVLLNIEDCGEPMVSKERSVVGACDDAPPDATPTIDPIELFEALLRNSERSRETRLPDPIFGEHDSTRFSSRRPSDSKWSESSRSQEILSTVAEHQNFPSSYTMNDFQTCISGSDLNDLTCLDPFMCPDALTSSLRESFFSAPSVPDSDIFTSFDENDDAPISPVSKRSSESNAVCNSASTLNLKGAAAFTDLQSRSTENVFRARHPSTRSCVILKLEPSIHRSRPRVRPCTDYILKDPLARKDPRLAPLASPTPTDISTPTVDTVSEMQNDVVGVNV